MTDEPVHYSYIHSTPDGIPFYVGKGLLRRALCVRRKNEKHQAMVAKFGPEKIRISLIECESHEHALEVERVLIQDIGKIATLTNKTAGGEGTVGYKHTEDAKIRMRASRTGRTLSADHKAAISRGGMGRIIKPETMKKMLAHYPPEATERKRQIFLMDNPARRPGVSGKISAAKTGKKRPDLSARLSGPNGHARRPEVREKFRMGKLGRVWVHLDKKMRLVHKAVAVELLSQGWKVGRK